MFRVHEQGGVCCGVHCSNVPSIVSHAIPKLPIDELAVTSEEFDRAIALSPHGMIASWRDRATQRGEGEGTSCGTLVVSAISGR